MIAIALICCTLLGFLAGLFLFRAKSRWCPRCGSTTMAMQQVLARAEQR